MVAESRAIAAGWGQDRFLPFQEGCAVTGQKQQSQCRPVAPVDQRARFPDSGTAAPPTPTTSLPIRTFSSNGGENGQERGGLCEPVFSLREAQPELSG